MNSLGVDALYHLATPEEWDDYQATGLIEPPSLVSEGFVHCSWGRQVRGTVDRHFAGVPHLLALRLDPGALGSVDLIEEDSYGSGQTFPHVYGPMPSTAVVDVTSVADDRTGRTSVDSASPPNPSTGS